MIFGSLKGNEACLLPAVFPIITQLHSHSYLYFQLITSNYWFINKLAPYLSNKEALHALSYLCKLIHEEKDKPNAVLPIYGARFLKLGLSLLPASIAPMEFDYDEEFD